MSCFSENLRKLRMTNNLTQKEIADTLRIAVNTYCNYEKGNREPDFEILSNIVKVFNVSYDQLFGYNSLSPNIYTLNDTEYSLILAYRKADDVGKEMIERIAGIEKKVALSDIV